MNIVIPWKTKEQKEKYLALLGGYISNERPATGGELAIPFTDGLVISELELANRLQDNCIPYTVEI